MEGTMATRKSAVARVSGPRRKAGQATGELTLLGRKTAMPARPEDAVLDRIPNADPDRAYVVRFTCPEFTSLCPVTGQPDFAHIVIDYVPRRWLVESKALKLYMQSFRNEASFHESVTVGIARRLTGELKPRWLRITAFFYPRGGIPIDVFFQTGEPPKGVYVPDPGVSPYRGRG
jgi:7-cyano-7-deazaguanine reductase